MVSQERNADSYAREHESRLRRGQANGSQFQRDRSYGEAFAYGSLTVHTATEGRDSLRVRLKEMLANPPTPSRSEMDTEAWTDGFKGIVRSLLAELKDE